MFVLDSPLGPVVSPGLAAPRISFADHAGLHTMASAYRAVTAAFMPARNNHMLGELAEL